MCVMVKKRIGQCFLYSNTLLREIRNKCSPVNSLSRKYRKPVENMKSTEIRNSLVGTVLRSRIVAKSLSSLCSFSIN